MSELPPGMEWYMKTRRLLHEVKKAIEDKDHNKILDWREKAEEWDAFKDSILSLGEHIENFRVVTKERGENNE